MQRPRHKRFDIQKHTRLRGGQGLQGVVPGDVSQPRAKDSQKSNADPAIECQMANFCKTMSWDE